MEATDAAYLAGILDGEGCLSVGWRLKKYITPTLQVTNTDKRLIDWLLDTLGGSVYEQPARPTRKRCWLWRCAGQVARRAIAEARPYLKIKGAQADLILNMTRVTEVRRDRLGRLQQTLTAEQHAANASLVSAIRALNRRGVDPLL